MHLQNNFSLSLLVLFFSLVLGPFSAGNEKILEPEDHGKIRVKRNLICALGLQGVIKNVFIGALKDVRKYDPIDLGDTEDGKLKSGVFYGLSTLTNSTALDIQCKGDKVIFGITLQLTDAQINYKWSQRVLFSFSGSIWTKVKALQFIVEVTWDMSKGMSFEVTNSKVTQLDGLWFGFKGLGPLNPVVSVIVNLLGRIWSEKISSMLADVIGESLSAQLDKMSLPF